MKKSFSSQTTMEITMGPKVESAEYMFQQAISIIDTNLSHSIDLLKRSSAMGHTRAMAHLGNAYYGGKGVEQDYGMAVYWYNKAIEDGDDDLAMNQLGCCYRYGHGVKKI